MDLHTPPPEPIGWIDRWLFLIAGADPDLLSLCPTHDRQIMRALGALLLLNWSYESYLLSRIMAVCSGSSEFQPQQILAAMGLASFVLAIDSFCVFRSHWWRQGIAQLAAAGLQIETGIAARLHAGLFFLVRFCLALGLALLTGLFLGLIIYAGDISLWLHDDYLRKNAHLIAETTTLVEGPIAAARETAKSQGSRVDALSHQVTELRDNQIDDPEARQARQEVTRLTAQRDKAQEELRAAEATASNEMGGVKTDATSGHPGNGPRRRAALEQVEHARTHADQVNRELEAARARFDKARAAAAASSQGGQSRFQAELPGYEQALSKEEAALGAANDRLAALENRREADIQSKLERSPDYMPQSSGLLSQLAALDAIAHDNPKVGWTILLIELCAVGFELASVLAVTGAPPTCYAALLVREGYLHDVSVADAIMEVLNGAKGDQSGTRPDDSAPRPVERRKKKPRPSTPPEANPFEAAGEAPDDAPQPQSEVPKRPRGRPRKDAAKAMLRDAVLREDQEEAARQSGQGQDTRSAKGCCGFGAAT